MYPNYSPNRLLERFFMIYSQWDWSKQAVAVVQPDSPKQYNNTMNIVVPSPPYENSCYNVTPQTLDFMKSNFEQSYKEITEIFRG